MPTISFNHLAFLASSRRALVGSINPPSSRNRPPRLANKITPRAFAISRPKIYREEFRCTIGLGALYNYSLVRTKRRARAHILSSTVKVCG